MSHVDQQPIEALRPSQTRSRRFVTGYRFSQVLPARLSAARQKMLSHELVERPGTLRFRRFAAPEQWNGARFTLWHDGTLAKHLCFRTRKATHEGRIVNKARSLLMAVLASALLVACDRSPQLNAEQEHAQQHAELENTIADDLGSNPQNPFLAAQTLAEDSIGAAVGRNLDQTWLRIMVEHQEGAVRFSDIVLRSRPSPPVRAAAEEIRKQAHDRIAALEELREVSLRGSMSGADAFGGTISDTFGRMTQVQGASVSQTWALKMAAYNRGAVTMAGVEATRGEDDRVRSLARELASALANEADQLERLAKAP